MPESRGALDSGLDRALEWAQDHRLDGMLLSGSQFEDDVRPVVVGRLQPWQRMIGNPLEAPGTTPPKAVGDETRTIGTARPTDLGVLNRELRAAAQELDLDRADFERWKFKPNLTGIVVIHGIGPQLAGQTLLDWTRPIITVLGDAVAADAAGATGEERKLADPDPDAGGLSDPVYKSNIDFSGETFPVLQVRVPRRRKQTAEEAAAADPLWIFTETWWASEVRPPTLRTMVGWLGEQGGVGRIVEGIQENTFGHGGLKVIASVSIQPFVSVIVSFALLLLIAGLAITRLIPIESVRSAAALKLASTFLTDWFGGARTLLRDPAQSANVRHRLVQTIKALRAYGCQRVVIVAHSGGTIVSLQTLTDPAYPDLHVDKLITHGEALNLAWRLEASDPDEKVPSLPAGHRMLGNLAKKDRLIWRDFFGTHDPAASGPPDPPPPMRESLVDDARFTTERTYNQMSIAGDHGAYWDNDEHFVIPLIREIDVPNGDRAESRFYSDRAESAVRARRKERMSFLRLWRRGTNTLPTMAILAAALVTSGGYLPSLGSFGMKLVGSIPFADTIGEAGRYLASLGRTDVMGIRLFEATYALGLLVLQAAFTLFVIQALVPSFASGLWYKRPLAKGLIGTIDWALGLGAFALVIGAWLLVAGRTSVVDGFVTLVMQSGILVILGAAVGIYVFAEIGKGLRRWLRSPRRVLIIPPEVIRGFAIFFSAAFLALLLVALALATLGVVLVLAGSNTRPDADQDRTRQFVMGAIVVLILYNALQRVGGWRWASWDVRERFALRRAPLSRPSRWWATLVGITLTVIAVALAVLLAVGTEGAVLPVWDRNGWTIVIIGLTVSLIILAIGKDVVDNDVEVDGRLTGSRADRPSPSMVDPSPTGAAAGPS